MYNYSVKQLLHPNIERTCRQGAQCGRRFLRKSQEFSTNGLTNGWIQLRSATA